MNSNSQFSFLFSNTQLIKFFLINKEKKIVGPTVSAQSTSHIQAQRKNELTTIFFANLVTSLSLSLSLASFAYWSDNPTGKGIEG